MYCNSKDLYRLTDTLLGRHFTIVPIGRQKINNYPDIPTNILCNKYVKYFYDNTCNIIHN